MRNLAARNKHVLLTAPVMEMDRFMTSNPYLESLSCLLLAFGSVDMAGILTNIKQIQTAGQAAEIAVGSQL